MLEFLFVLMCQAAAGAPTAPDPAPPAAAQQPAATDAATATQSDVRETVRCRRIQATGSRIAARRCTTLRQDEEQRRNSREQLDLMHDSGRHQNPQGS